MRTRLDTMQPPQGTNVDLPDVKANLSALGTAVYTILGTDAVCVSDATIDAMFWNWVLALATWSNALSAWQQAVTTAFGTWAPASPADVALKAAIAAIPPPGASPPLPAPTSLQVDVR
jgi:hypothetical protein